MALAVRCTIIGTAPCTLREAAALVKGFAASDFLPGDGVTSSYVHTVSKALRQNIAREKDLLKQTHLLTSRKVGLQGSQLTPSIGREQGVSQGHVKVDRKGRKRVSASGDVGQKSLWCEKRENDSVAPKLNHIASVDGVEKGIVATDETRSRNRKRKKGDKVAPQEDTLASASTILEDTRGTQDRGEERRKDRKKVRSAECRPVTDEQDLVRTLDIVKPSNRKRRRREKVVGAQGE